MYIKTLEEPNVWHAVNISIFSNISL